MRTEAGRRTAGEQGINKQRITAENTRLAAHKIDRKSLG